MTVPSSRGAGEEVNSPVGGARGDGGDVEGGIFASIKISELNHLEQPSLEGFCGRDDFHPQVLAE